MKRAGRTEHEIKQQREGNTYTAEIETQTDAEHVRYT
jgi:hypothetical protein